MAGRHDPRQRCKDADEVLIRRHRDRIYRIALRMLGIRTAPRRRAGRDHPALDSAGLVHQRRHIHVALPHGHQRRLNHHGRAYRIGPLTETDHSSAAGADDAVNTRHQVQAALAAKHSPQEMCVMRMPRPLALREKFLAVIQSLARV
jgi:hypothetical protein